MTEPAGAIIASRSADVVNLARKVLKELKIEDVGSFNEVPAIMKAMIERQEAVLLLDWGLGVDEAVKVLEEIQSVHPAGTRPQVGTGKWRRHHPRVCRSWEVRAYR